MNLTEIWTKVVFKLTERSKYDAGVTVAKKAHESNFDCEYVDKSFFICILVREGGDGVSKQGNVFKIMKKGKMRTGEAK